MAPLRLVPKIRFLFFQPAGSGFEVISHFHQAPRGLDMGQLAGRLSATLRVVQQGLLLDVDHAAITPCSPIGPLSESAASARQIAAGKSGRFCGSGWNGADATAFVVHREDGIKGQGDERRQPNGHSNGHDRVYGLAAGHGAMVRGKPASARSDGPGLQDGDTASIGRLFIRSENSPACLSSRSRPKAGSRHRR